MADLSYIQQAQEIKITGQDSTGTTVNYVSADANGNLAVKDYADGATGSAVPPNTTQIGGSDGTNLRTLATDTSGRLKVAPSTYFHPLFNTRVQLVTNTTSVAATSLATTIAATTAGNTLIVCACVNAGTLSITDNASQAYSTATTIAGQATESSKIFYFPNTAAGVTSITISSTSSTDMQLIIVEYSGILTASPLDRTSTNGQTGTTTWTSGLTAATTQASELLIGSVMNTLHNNTTLTPDTAWTSLATVDNGRGAANLGLNMSQQNVSVTGTYAFTGTGGASDNLYAAIATFKRATPNTVVALNSPYTIKSGAGVLQKVIVNTIGTGSASVTLYDGTSTAGTVIATLSLTSPVGSVNYLVNFTTGLTIVVNSLTADMTVVYD